MFRSRVAASALPLTLGGLLAGIAFYAEGGTELTSATVAHIVLVLVSAAVVAAALIVGRRGPLCGGGALLLFTAFAVLTAVSVNWAVAPGLTYVEAGRTFTYLAVFAAAIAAARLAPDAAPRVLQGLLVAAIVPVLYALASRVWPATLAANEVSNRLGAPFEYWNAVGTVAAMAIPICLWLGSRVGGSVAARVLAYPALGISTLALLLTQSRAAALAAAVGAIGWFALVPLRIRSLPVLLVPLGAASAVGVWALSKDPFSVSQQPLDAKQAVAGDFGLLILLMILLLLLAGAAVNTGMDRRGLSLRTRRRIGLVAVAGACLVPLAAFTSVAFSERGIGDRIDELTSETQVAPAEGGGRVFAAASSRGKYWREAGRVFADREWTGVGAGAFAVARLRHRTDATVSRHAHGWIPQTLADLGVIGLGLSTLLLVAWGAAVLRALQLLPRRVTRFFGGPEIERRDWTGERTALCALAIVPVVFGVQLIVDWTWFIPAPAAMALVSAGFVAGRGPLPVAPEEGSVGEPLRRGSGREGILPAASVMLIALIVAWVIWQPEASHRATDDALDLSEERRFDAALAKTQEAQDENPLSPDPLLVRAAVQTDAGEIAEAQRSLEQAVLGFPGEPQTWYRLAAFQLGTLDEPEQAAETVRGALYLDPHGPANRQLFLDAQARAREQGAAEGGGAAPPPGG